MWQYWVTFPGTNQTSCYTKGLGECVTRKPAVFVSEDDVKMVACGNVCGWTALILINVINVEEPALLCLGIFRESHAVPSSCS